MNTLDRFYDCDSAGFPPVGNYDYETNVPIRGIENRSFRWEEVAVPTAYLLKEATSGGTFEDNTYRTNFSIPYPTGVNFITTGNANTGSYIGWTLTGSRIVYIGISGVFAHTGNLTGITSSFQAHPIQGNESLGLYYTGGSPPVLYSNRIATGLEGPFIPDGDHQLYLQSKLNYNTSGQIRAYLRGWDAGSIVAYYNPYSSTWDASAPTGVFQLNTGTYTTIKYRFTLANFPGTTPSSFDVYIQSSGINSFVTIDDIHVDAYMKKNAFVDYIVPDGYLLQLTPDLGWHDIVSMFDSSDALPNPFLKTLGPFRVDLGNLVDNFDNSVTAIMDQTDLLDSTTNTYKKYLWRALPITPNGQPGPGGYPSRFEYIGDSINFLFTVDNVLEDDTSSTKTILGTKSSTMTILVDGMEDYPGLEYPTPITWRLVINLSTITRTISIQAMDSGGTLSSTKYILLTSKLYDQNSLGVWNVFDEHGLKADLERLPNESNYNYSLRIKDVYKNKGGSYFVGIVNGATRELGLNKISDALNFSLLRDKYNTPVADSIDIEVTSYSIRISTSSFLITEKLFVDPIYKTVDLLYRPKEIPVFTIIPDGAKIDQKDISLEECCTDSIAVYRLKINNNNACGKFIEVTYSYDIELLFKEHLDLYSLIRAINEITNPSGNKIIFTSISSKLSGNESCLGLFISENRLTPKESIAISWSPIYLKKISDRGYRDYFIKDSNTNLRDTEYYSYVSELKKNTKIFWGSVEADRDRWDAADSKDLAMDSIPTLFDPPISKITSTLTGSPVILEAVTAWGRGYLGYSQEFLFNVGLSSNLFQPGVAYKTDLQPDIFISASNSDINSPIETNVGPRRNDNVFLIFSGQR